MAYEILRILAPRSTACSEQTDSTLCYVTLYVVGMLSLLILCLGVRQHSCSVLLVRGQADS